MVIEILFENAKLDQYIHKKIHCILLCLVRTSRDLIGLSCCWHLAVAPK
jgi:hypothetical protein